MRKLMACMMLGMSGTLFMAPAIAQTPSTEDVFTQYSLPTLSADANSVLARLRTEHAAASIQVVRLNAEALTDAPASAPRTLGLGADRFDSVTRQTTRLADGSVIWKGTIPPTNTSLPAGTATLIVQGKTATGTVSAPDGRRFQIRPIGGDATAVIQLDFARLGKEEPPSTPGIAAAREPMANAVAAPVKNPVDAVPTIDLLVAYTTTAAKSSGGIDPLIALAAIETNETFVNSGISARVRVVEKMQAKIDENGKSYEEIMAALVGAGDIAARRNARHADVVVLLVNQPQYCGLADDIKAAPEKAFVVVHYACATGYYSFGHEIGHLIGGRHNVDMDNSSADYPYGHGLSRAVNGFRTVMGYACEGAPCDPRIPYWSNPNVLFNGRPTGDAATANNARVWNERAAEVAGFR